MESTSLHIGTQTSPKMAPSMPAMMQKKVVKSTWHEVINDYLVKMQPIRIADKVSFFRLLATMINAGISIITALNILREQASNKHMKAIVKEMEMKIEAGESFSAALSAYPKYFTPAQIGMVEAGEASGQLNQTLNQIADQIEKEATFRARVKGAMVYPIVIITIMVIAFVIVMVVVMPKIKEMFDGLGGTLPKVTLGLIAISDFFMAQTFGLSNVVWMAFVFAALLLIFLKWKKTNIGSHLWTRFVFSLPIFGVLAKKASLAHFCRSLSIMVGSGIPIIKALRIAAVSVGNPVYERRIQQVADDVKHGISMAENMKDGLYYFPSVVVGMINVAEQTAQIDSISKKLANHYEDEVDATVKSLSSLMEPFLMVVIGLAVGFLVIAVMKPILSASELIV